MNRLFVLLGLAAFGAGCGTYSSAPCMPNSLTVYWAPGATGPVAGFSVPGLLAAGFPSQLDCAGAGIARIEVDVNGVPVNCSGGVCVGADWACGSPGTGGMQTAGYPLQGGDNVVDVFGFDAGGNQKYAGEVHVYATCGGDPVVGVVSSGVAGPLSIDYAFTDSSPCQPGSSIDWDLRSGLSAPFDTGSIACGTTNPFDVYRGAAVPAGVYTLVNVAELVGTTSYHAYCSATPFVHAGPESVLVDMAPSNATCF